MTLHLVASDPAFPAVNELAALLAVAANPHLTRLELDLPDAEQRALRAILTDEMQKRIDAGSGALIEFAERVMNDKG